MSSSSHLLQQSPLHTRSSFRSPRRITITIPYSLLEALIERSRTEGRSLSNLAAYLLEQALDERTSVPERAAP